MNNIPELLYHYMSRQKADQVRKAGTLPPSAKGTYLSVDEKGNFTEAHPTGPPGAGWLSGRSDTPNIFLTDTPPEKVAVQPFGAEVNREYFIELTRAEIIDQGLRIFKNPSKEYDNIYNVPVVVAGGLIIDKNRIYKIS